METRHSGPPCTPTEAEMKASGNVLSLVGPTVTDVLGPTAPGTHKPVSDVASIRRSRSPAARLGAALRLRSPSPVPSAISNVEPYPYLPPYSVTATDASPMKAASTNAPVVQTLPPYRVKKGSFRIRTKRYQHETKHSLWLAQSSPPHVRPNSPQPGASPVATAMAPLMPSMPKKPTHMASHHAMPLVPSSPRIVISSPRSNSVFPSNPSAEESRRLSVAEASTRPSTPYMWTHMRGPLTQLAVADPSFPPDSPEVAGSVTNDTSGQRLPDTFARTAFYYGFVFPPLWVVGASVMVLTAPASPVAGDDIVKHMDQTMAARREELRWARRCLVAAIGACVLLGSVVAISVVVGA